MLHVGVGSEPARAIVSSDGFPAVANVDPSARCPLFVEPYAVAVGVGRIGEDEDAVPLVRGAEGGSREAIPLRVVPERGQLSENDSEPPSKESCGVLHDEDARSKFANDAGDLEEKGGSLASESGSSPGGTEILAGEAGAEDVDAVEVPPSAVDDVPFDRRMRPPPREHAPRECFYLDVPRDDGIEARRCEGTLDAKVEQPDPRAERTYRNHV